MLVGKTRMHANGADGKTVRTTVPRLIVRVKAEKEGIDLNEFMSQYILEWNYDPPEVTVKFVRRDGSG